MSRVLALSVLGRCGRPLAPRLAQSHAFAFVARPRFLCSGAEPQPKPGPHKQNQVITGGTLFRFINPELYMNTKNTSTWILVAAVWIVFGGRWMYLSWEERTFEEAERERAGRHARGYGPSAPPRR